MTPEQGYRWFMRWVCALAFILVTVIASAVFLGALTGHYEPLVALVVVAVLAGPPLYFLQCVTRAP